MPVTHFNSLSNRSEMEEFIFFIIAIIITLAKTSTQAYQFVNSS